MKYLFPADPVLILSRHCIVSNVFPKKKRSSFWSVQRKHFAKTTLSHSAHITKTYIKCVDSVVEWFASSRLICACFILNSTQSTRRTCDLMAKNVNYAMLKRHINAKFNCIWFSYGCM